MVLPRISLVKMVTKVKLGHKASKEFKAHKAYKV